MPPKYLADAPGVETWIARLDRQKKPILRGACEIRRDEDRVIQQRQSAGGKERDKARRVARVLVGPAKHLKVLGHDLTVDELKALRTALAYPEPKL